MLYVDAVHWYLKDVTKKVGSGKRKKRPPGFKRMERTTGLDDTLGQHGVGDLQEASDVGTNHVVALEAVLLGSLVGHLVDVDHDGMEFLVHFLTGPGQPEAVLGHLQTGGGDTAGVGSLAGTEGDTFLDEEVNSLGGGGHVGTLANGDTAAGNQSLGVLQVQLVLGGAGEGHIELGQFPGPLTWEELTAVLLGVLLDTAAADVLELHDKVPLLTRDPIRIVDGPAGIREGDNLAAQLVDLLGCVLCNVSGAGDGNGLALEIGATNLQHLLGEVDTAVAGGFRPDERSAPLQALAGENAGEGVGDLPVLTVHETDLTAANADVASRDVGVRTNMPVELAHETLAKAHDLAIGLALGVEIGTTLAAAHGEAGEGVLEDLLEAKELDDTQVHGRMEPQAALVGADGTVEFDPEATVNLDFTLVVHPGNPEHDLPLGLDDALHNLCLGVFGVFLQNRLKRVKDLFYSLVELLLTRVSPDNLLVDSFGYHYFKLLCWVLLNLFY